MNINILVEQYMPLANKLAFKHKKRIPLHIDIEDLRSAAYFGLVQAANRFDKFRDVNFASYAFIRINGSINDYLRSLNWGTRNKISSSVSIYDENSDCEGLFSYNFDDTFNEILEYLNPENEKVSKIVRMYIIDGLSMKEIGDNLNLSEGRISQIFKKFKKQTLLNYSIEDFCKKKRPK